MSKDVTTMTPAIRESLVEYMRLDEGAAQLLDCAALYVEKGWTTKVNARDANGLGVCPEDRPRRAGVLRVPSWLRASTWAPPGTTWATS